MIERIVEGWALSAMPLRALAEDRRSGGRDRRRPLRAPRPADGVEIDADVLEMAAIGAFDPDLADSPEIDDVLVSAAELCRRLAGAPRRAIEAQARLGAHAVHRLIAVNAMNRV